MRLGGATGLALRIVRGTGGSGAIRILVLVAAMAVAVTTALVIVFVPAISTHRADALRTRALQPAPNGVDARFAARSLDGSVGDQPLRRILIAASAGTPPPPGSTRTPRSGEVIASPALQRLLHSQAFVRALVPGRIVGTVSPQALTDPDELFAYVGVAPTPEVDPVIGFGGSAVADGDPSVFTALQLALFVLVPAGGFLIVASTLSSRSRGRRWDAMRSVSVPETTIGRVAALETGLVSLLGGAAGLVLFSAVRHSLAGHGLGGLRWFPADLRLTPTIALVTLVAVAWTGALLGRHSARIRPIDSLHEGNRAHRGARRALPLACGLAMLGSMVVLHHAGRVANSAPLFLAGSLLAVAGLGLMLVSFVRGTGALVARRATRLAWRLGGHRASYEPRSIVRILAGLVALVVVGHLTFAVLTDLRVATGGDLDRVVASTSVDRPSHATVSALTALRPEHAAIGHTALDESRPASISYLSCTSLSRAVIAPKPCRVGDTYRVATDGFPSDLQAGHAYRFETADGGSRSVTAPLASAIDRHGLLDSTTIVVAGPPPTVDPLAIGEVRYVVARTDLVHLEAEVARIDPSLIVDSQIEPEKVQAYEQQRSVAQVGALLGGLLATLCFVVASVDRLLERRSHTASLVAIGVPRRVLRTSQVAQLLLPLLATLGASNVVGWMIAQAYLAMGGITTGVPWMLMIRGLTLSGAALLVAAAVGALVSVPEDLVTSLRSE